MRIFLHTRVEIGLLKRREINDKLWNECVLRSICPLIYAQTWYLDTVCDDWYGIAAVSGGRYVAVMPLPRGQKFGFAFYKQPLFVQQLGVFSEPEYQTKELYDEFFKIMDENFLLITRYPFHYKTNFELLPRENIEVFFTHHISLNKDFSELTRNFRKDRRRDCKKMLEKRFEESNSVSEMLELFFIKNASKIAGGVNPEAKLVFENLYATLQANCSVKLLTAFEGKEAAYAFFAEFSGIIYYLFNSGTGGNSFSLRAGMIASVLCEESGSEKIFDFESAQSAPVADFYSSFGAEKIPFYVYSRDSTGIFLKTLRKFRRFMKDASRVQQECTREASFI
jgi:hypothetical protein